MKFSKKTAHRLIIALSMFAPVLYLFGALFFGLAGAHGEQLWAQEVGEYEHSEVVDFDVGYWVWREDGHVYEDANGCISEPYYVDVEVSSYSFSVGSFQLNNSFIRVFLYGANGYIGDLENQSGETFINFVPSSEVVSFRLGYAYFNFEPLAYLKSYYNTSLPAISSIEYSDFIFGQMFPRDNFLVRVGANALSAEPVGFAPFGAFLSYLDQNMLHASESQMALMIYGEVYWALHIVLADLVYHVAVFFPNLIERVFDWFGQKGLNDD